VSSVKSGRDYKSEVMSGNVNNETNDVPPAKQARNASFQCKFYDVRGTQVANLRSYDLRTSSRSLIVSSS